LRRFPPKPTADTEGFDVTESDIQKIEAHLRRLFGSPTINVRPRPRLKDSAEVYVGEEFVGVVTDDEDDPGSFNFNMGIIAEDLA